MIEQDEHPPVNTVNVSLAGMEEARVYRTEDYKNKSFTSRRRDKWLERFDRKLALEAFNLVGSDSHIVDIPCGNGRFFEIFSKARKLTLADYSMNMLKVCEERFGEPQNVRLIRADITSLPLLDNSADLCFCMRLFHHMRTDDVRLSALRELARVVNKNKYVALSFYNRSCWRFLRKKILGKKISGSYITFSRMIGLAKQAGLECVKRFPRLNLVEEQCLVVFRKS